MISTLSALLNRGNCQLLVPESHPTYRHIYRKGDALEKVPGRVDNLVVEVGNIAALENLVGVIVEEVIRQLSFIWTL